MAVSIRPWLTTGVTFVSAGAIALAPISPAPSALQMHAPAAAFSTSALAPQVQLSALEIPYILTLPVVRQSIRNWAENWAVYLAGFGKSGVGLVESLLSIPGVTVEIVQQLVALDFVGAFDTFAAAVRDSVVAVGEPLLDSLIWRNQKYFLVEAALQSARPQAFIDIINGFLAAGNEVTTSFIEGTQNFVAALLTLDLGNIIDAAISGTQNFFVALGEGAGSIVNGIELAQKGIADALATTPPPSPFIDTASPTAAADAAVSVVQVSKATTVDDSTSAPEPTSTAVDVIDTAPAVDPQDATEAPAAVEESDDDTTVLDASEPADETDETVTDKAFKKDHTGKGTSAKADATDKNNTASENAEASDSNEGADNNQRTKDADTKSASGADE